MADKSLSDELMEEAGMTVEKKQPEGANPGPIQPTGGNNPPPDDADEDIDEEKLLKIIQKRNPGISSLADIAPKKPEPTDEEKNAEVEAKKGEVLKFAIDKKLFSKSDYDQYLKDSNAEAKDILFPVYKEQIKNSVKDHNLSDEDIEDAFNEEYGLLEKEDSWKYKNGQEKLKRAKEQVLSNKYKNIVTAEKVYDGVQNKISSAKNYSAQVNETFARIPKQVSITIDGQTYTEDVDPEFIESTKSNYLSDEMMQSLTTKDGKIDAEFLQQDVLSDFFGKNFNRLVESVAKKHAKFLSLNDRSGRRNMPLKDSEIQLSNPKKQDAGVKGESDRLLEEAGMS